MDRIKELIDQYRYYVIGISVGLLFVMGMILVMQTKPKTESFDGLSHNQSTSMSSASLVSTISSTSSSVTSDSKLVVDIKGAVKNAGIYKVEDDTRIADLVELAGGFKSNADQKNVNLAQKLSDQQVVYIPLKGEIKGNLHLNSDSSSTASNAETSNSGDSNGKININTADKSQLQTINGIGEKKADNIINYRQQSGGFKSIDDVKNTDGIGDKMFENIKDSITV
ncbi:helix-hairpin-helix domain-containing protein [Nicoliella lavandulae]|uniref:Helix-hairpin-helix domain-containing protein n=1 Tax=Nicoliella lavandulae TaxID=3082954 RepID=A0ABU8SLH7_9LACO